MWIPFRRNLDNLTVEVDMTLAVLPDYLGKKHSHKLALCCTTSDQLAGLQKVHWGYSIKTGSNFISSKASICIDAQTFSKGSKSFKDQLVSYIFKFAVENGLNVILTHQEDGFEAIAEAYENTYYSQLHDHNLDFILKTPDQASSMKKRGLFIWNRTPETEELATKVAQEDSPYFMETMVASSGITVFCAITSKPTPGALHKAWKELLVH